ncbi:MAG: class I SAM-dependent methyltransferase [Thermoanaerobaculia bacterium]
MHHAPFEVDACGETVTGVVSCSACEAWFPVEDGILELLHGELAYEQDRARFASSHQDSLKTLGLPARTADSRNKHAEAVRRQQEHFDWYADNEEQTYSTYEATPFWRAADAIAFGEWRREVRPGGKLLDVACAQGRSTFPWIDLDLDIIAFDISKPLVRQARDRIRKAGGRASTDFLVADASRFPFVSDRFDYVVTYGVLHHLPDPAQACGEIMRVLKAGGTYFGSENNKTVFRGLFDVLQRVLPLWHEEAGAEPLISRRDLQMWLEPHDARVKTRTSVFLPPHLVNLVGPAAAEKLLRLTDRLADAVPWVRHQGGLILVKGVKGRSF